MEEECASPAWSDVRRRVFPYGPCITREAVLQCSYEPVTHRAPCARFASTRVGALVMLIEDVIGHCQTSMNERTALHSLDVRAVSFEDLYRYVSVLLLSPLAGLSFEKNVGLLSDLGYASTRVIYSRLSLDGLMNGA